MSAHLLLPLLMALPGQAPATGPLPKLNVILFTPADVTPPRGYQQRMNEVADYTETFLVEWMKHWGYPPARRQIFDRQPNGDLRVLLVQGEHKRNSGKYDKPTFAPEVWSKALQKYQLGQHRHVWWVWVYLGNASGRFADFRGSGDVKGGGTAFVNFPVQVGRITLQQDLGSPLLKELAIKGCIHELGHAFGLPHNGPVARENLGMPLMGANIPNFWRRTGSSEPRAYLTAASAAMLWRHPVLSGTTAGRNTMPKFRVTDLDTTRDGTTGFMHVTGTLSTDIPAHSVVVLDSVPNQQEAYWQKSYVSRIDESGRFEVAITEPTRSAGTLRVLFCFENGAITGDGQKYGIPGALERDYVPAAGQYRLKR